MIPGQRYFKPPDTIQAQRLSTFRPFVRQLGYEKRTPWFLGERKLLDYLIIYIAEGEGTFRIGSSTFRVSNDSLVWIPPNTLHEMRGTKLMHFVWMHFDLVYDPERSHWDACIPANVKDLSSCDAYMHPPVDDPVVSKWCGLLNVHNGAHIMEALLHIYREYGRSTPNYISAKMNLVIDSILRGLKDEQSPVSIRDNKIKKSIEMLREQVLKRVDFHDLAYRFGFSLGYFRECFREITGLSPRAYHQMLRMQKACELLVYSNDSVSVIGDKLGFSTVHNFSRAFHNQYGVSPSQYRNRGDLE